MPWVKSNLGSVALVLVLHAQTAAAQGDPLGADEMAEYFDLMDQAKKEEKAPEKVEEVKEENAEAAVEEKAEEVKEEKL